MIKTLSFIILFLLEAHAATSIELVYPTREGKHEVKIEIAEIVKIEKLSNYFNETKLSPIGKLEILPSKVQSEIESIERIRRNMEVIKANLKEFDKDIKDLLPPKTKHAEGHIKIGEHIISEQSSYYPLVRERIVKILDNKDLKEVDTAKIDFARSKYIRVKDGKSSEEFIRIAGKCKRVNNEFYCKDDKGIFYHSL